MAKDRIERDELAGKLMETASVAEDPLRAMAEMMADFVMEAEVSEKIGAEPYERSEGRITQRNGCRPRRWDTRLGTMRLQIPKLREGGYVPSFIERWVNEEEGVVRYEGSALVLPGFIALPPEWLRNGAAFTAPLIPASDSALGPLPSVALSSAHVTPS